MVLPTCPAPWDSLDSDIVARGAGDGGDPECAFAQERDTVGAGRICDGVTLFMVVPSLSTDFRLARKLAFSTNCHYWIVW